MMNDAVKLIKLICDVLSRLSEEEMTALLENKAKLKVEFPDSQKSGRGAVELTDSFFKGLESFDSREKAAELFKQSGFRKTTLIEIARRYSIPVTMKDNNAQIIERIIESVVGSKLKHEALLTANLHRSE